MQTGVDTYVLFYFPCGIFNHCDVLAQGLIAISIIIIIVNFSPATEKAPVVSLRLVPGTWKLPHAADCSLLSWQGMHKSVIDSGALPWMRLDT